MSLLTDGLAGILKPLADVIEHVTISGEDKAKLQQAHLQVAVDVATAGFDYEKQLLAGQQDVIKAEAVSANWLTSSWRPITMLTFLALVVCDSFGWLPNRLASQAWTLLQIGLGGYTIGRSLEKVAPSVVAAITK